MTPAGSWNPGTTPVGDCNAETRERYIDATCSSRSRWPILCSFSPGSFSLKEPGSNGLPNRKITSQLEVFETAARYQMYHALALIAVALVLAHVRARGGDSSAAVLGPAPGTRLTVASGWLFVIGTALFSGSLYAMTVTGIRALGAITPLGGVAFIAGWVCLAVAAMRSR